MSALLQSLMQRSPSREALSRDTTLIFGLVLAAFSLFDGLYLWLSPDSGNAVRWSFFAAASVSAVGSLLAFGRYFNALWLPYAMSGVFIATTAFYDVLLAVQLLAPSVVALRLHLPRRASILFTSLFLALVSVAVLLSPQAPLFSVAARFVLNAVLIFILVDTLLENFQRDIPARRLVLFDAVYPALIATGALKLAADVWLDPEGRVQWLAFAIMALWLLPGLLRRFSPSLFQLMAIVLLTFGAMLQFWGWAFMPEFAGAGWGLLLVAVMLGLPRGFNIVMAPLFISVVLLKMLQVGLEGFYTQLWAVFSLLSIWFLLDYTLNKFTLAEPSADQEQRLGLSGREWRQSAWRFVGYVGLVSLLIGGVLAPLLSQLTVMQHQQWQQSHHDTLTSLVDDNALLIGRVLEVQRAQLANVDMDEPSAAFAAVGRRLQLASPQVLRWRWVDEHDLVRVDLNDVEVIGVGADDGEPLRRALAMGRRLQDGRSFISSIQWRQDPLVANEMAAWIYVVTPAFDAQGIYRGAAVANVSQATFLNRLPEVVTAGFKGRINIIDNDGFFVFRALDGLVVGREHWPSDSLAITDNERFTAIQKHVGSFFRAGRIDTFVEKIRLGQIDVGSVDVYARQPYAYMVFDYDRDATGIRWFSQGWVWVLLVLLLALVILLAWWLTMAWLRKHRLDTQWQVQQTALLEAERVGAEALAAENSKAMFLSNMSHEMRTPLNGLIGISQILRGNYQESQYPTLLGMLRDSAERLSRLVNDILDISAIHEGKLSLQTATFDLQTMLASIEYKQRFTAQQRGLAFVVDTRGVVGSKRLGDEQRLGQVIDNLLTNAFKFTNIGSVTLTVSATPTSVRIQVVDTGIGMSDEVQARIFTRFEQGDLSTTKRHQGAGLGLSICAELVEMMGGVIEVTSTLGEGSCFVVEVPLVAVDEQAEASTAEQELTLLGRVLIVDDDSTNLLVMAEVLKGWGTEVLTAGNGSEALALLDSERIDVVITDIAMPVMSGLELLQQLQHVYPSLPCLAVTGNVTSEELQRYRSLGFAQIFVKPLDYARVKQMLAKYLAKAAA